MIGWSNQGRLKFKLVVGRDEDSFMDRNYYFFLSAQTFSLKEKLYQQTFFHKESGIKGTYIFHEAFFS